MHYGLNDNSMSNSETPVDKVSIDHAKGEINQFTRKAIDRLGQNQLVDARGEQASKTKINDIAAHAQALLVDLRTQSQIDFLLTNVRLHMDKVLAKVRFSVIINLVFNKIKQASLNQTQQDSARTEVLSAKRYVYEDLAKASDQTTIGMSVTSGINAINGALSKYVVDSQINSVDKVRDLFNNLKSNVDHNQHLHSDTKLLFQHKLSDLEDKNVQKLLVSYNFVDLARHQKQCTEQITKLVKNQGQLFKNLEIFEKFVQQVKETIVSLSMSANEKLVLEHQIDADRDALLNKIKAGSYQDINNQLFKAGQRQIILTVLDTVAKHGQKKISSKVSSLHSDQRKKLVNQINDVMKQMKFDLKGDQWAESSKEMLMRGLHRLGSITKAHHNFVYKDQIQKVVDNLKDSVNSQADLSGYYRKVLTAQIAYLGRQLQSEHDINKVHDKLYKFYRHQISNLETTLLKYHVTNFLKQIKFSHIQKVSQKKITAKLTAIQKNSKLNYTNKQLFFKNVKDASYKEEYDEVLNHVIALGRQMVKLAGALNNVDLHVWLVTNLKNFKRDMDKASRIIDLDHLCQTYENRIYRKVYQLKIDKNSPQDRALYKVMSHIDQVHHQYDSMVLDSDLHLICVDRIDRVANPYINQIMQLTNTKDLDKQLTMLDRDVDQTLNDLLKIVKRYYARQMNHNVYTFRYQLMTMTNESTYEPLLQIRYRSLAKVRNSQDLLHVEATYQQGTKQMNDLVNKIVDKHDAVKAQAHKFINQIMATVKHQLGQNRDLSIDNQILRIINQSNIKINQVASDQVSIVYQKCYYDLDQVIRTDYLKRWNDIINNALTMITKLANIGKVYKKKAIQSIKLLKGNVIAELETCEHDQLDKTLLTMRAKAQKIVSHTIFLDPVKRGVRTELNRLTLKIKQDINQFVGAKQRAHVMSRLEAMNQNIDHKLSVSPDKDVQPLLHASEKQLKKFQLNLVMDYYLNSYNEASHRANQAVNGFKYLANEQLRKANDQMNQDYHKTIYGIKKSKDAYDCRHNCELGKQEADHVVKHYRSINDRKQRIIKMIKQQADHSMRVVKSFKFLKKNDKQSGELLLKQTYQQAVRNVKQATAAKQIFAAENKSIKVIKWVVNEVSSANVLLSAIRSADTQISNSKLDTEQKENALKQIHQIINSGIKSQALKAKVNKDKATKSTAKPRSHKWNQSMPHRDKPKHTNPIVAFINAVRHFFKWFFGKLAQTF